MDQSAKLLEESPDAFVTVTVAGIVTLGKGECVSE